MPERVWIANASYGDMVPIIFQMMDALHLRSWYEGLSGKKVFIKPNMIGLFPPDQHATTHPTIVAALVKIFRQVGAEVLVGDNCGLGGYGLNQKVAKVTGIMEAADGAYKNVAADTVLVKLNSRHMDSIVVSRDMLEADVLISVPKMKTHTFTVVTGAVKNMFGMVAGAGKSQCHKSAPKTEDFAALLGDLFQIRPPDLSIMDGIIAMEGNGPTAGTTKPVGKMLASTNAVALDAVMCNIMGMPPNEVLHLRKLSERGYGPLDSEEIDIIGDDPETLRFKLPVTIKRFGFLGWLISASFFGFVTRSKMVLSKKLCKKCKICVEGCPTTAMQMGEFPHIDEDKCIKCMCCHELCPESAWEVKGLMMRLQGRGV